VVSITVTCSLWAPSSGDYLFTCGAIYLPPQQCGQVYWWQEFHSAEWKPRLSLFRYS